MLMLSVKINAPRAILVRGETLSGLPSVTIQNDRIRPTFGGVNPQSEKSSNRPSAGFFVPVSYISGSL
jgi:hypothetical protein